MSPLYKTIILANTEGGKEIKNDRGAQFISTSLIFSFVSLNTRLWLSFKLEAQFSWSFELEHAHDQLPHYKK